MSISRLIKAIGTSFIVVFLITMMMGVNLLSSILVAVVPCVIGIVVGLLMYYIVTGGADRWPGVRFGSGLLSGILAAGLDWFVFVHGSKPAMDIPQFAVMVNIGIAYTCIVAGLLGILFGANILHIFKDDKSV